MRSSVFIKSYAGYGDNIWLYPFIKQACKKYSKVYLETAYPFLYHALPNIEFVKPSSCSTLKTCQRYIKSYSRDFWAKTTSSAKHINIPYYLSEIKKGISLMKNFNSVIPIDSEKIDFSLPVRPEWLKEAKNIIKELDLKNKKLCIIKPPADRKDWKNTARIPKPEYFQFLIDSFKDEYYFITIGNQNIDVYIDELKNIDKRFDRGELSLTTIIGLVSLADMIITYNCFFFPLGLSVNTKTLVINGGYTDPNLYVDKDLMDLSNVRIVTPEPCCTCVDRTHKCNKEISTNLLYKRFVELKNSISDNYTSSTIVQPKKNLLISRMRAERCHKIATNPLIKENFNIYTIDHTMRNYNLYKSDFESSFDFVTINDICRPSLTQEQEQKIYNQCEYLLNKFEIDLVLNAQPLHPYNEIMQKACKAKGIRAINTETFCDDKWLFDDVGCQYVCPNEIYQYVSKIPISGDISIDYPKSTRQPQKDIIDRETFFRKYNLNENSKYIVLLGQLMWDMSVKKTVNPEIQDYPSYVSFVLKNNPDTTFIVKHHPIYYTSGRIHEMDFLKGYPNVIVIENENIETLFNIFDNFTSFSSTTTFEGIIRNKKFATIGFHYCNNDDLVLQLRTSDKVKNLYNQLNKFQIKNTTKNRYMRFICNYYTIDLSSEKLFYRLTLPNEQYFSLQF